MIITLLFALTQLYELRTIVRAFDWCYGASFGSDDDEVSRCWGVTVGGRENVRILLEWTDSKTLSAHTMAKAHTMAAEVERRFESVAACASANILYGVAVIDCVRDGALLGNSVGRLIDLLEPLSVRQTQEDTTPIVYMPEGPSVEEAPNKQVHCMCTPDQKPMALWEVCLGVFSIGGIITLGLNMTIADNERARRIQHARRTRRARRGII